jgi:hypothetical protein
MKTAIRNSRRDFIKKSSLAAAAFAIPPIAEIPQFPLSLPGNEALLPVSGLKEPLAIAMWDFSWILRHHRYGEFEDWERVLEDLAGRGYNAIRIDAMPQFVVSGKDGKIEQEFRSVKEGWVPSLWGNDYTMSFRPRESLLEFLPMCRKAGIRVGLATWFMRHGTERNDIFMEEGGLVRAWDETLTFLQQHGLLDGILYVDLLNEYPNWHGYDWFKNEINRRSDIAQFRLDNPDANVPGFDPVTDKGNPLVKLFYNDFINNAIAALKKKFPELDFFASLDSGMALDQIDLTHFQALDYHVWFAHKGGIPGLGEVSSRNQALDYRLVYKDLKDYWVENRVSLISWMDGRIKAISRTAAAHNMVCGNTEGWGPIFWFDHPELDWRWVMESAEICIDLAVKHQNYKFLCTSNFTHPQFRGIWDDIAWHRKMTSRIRSGK